MSETFQQSTVLAILMWSRSLGNYTRYVVHHSCPNLNAQNLNELHRDFDPPGM